MNKVYLFVALFIMSAFSGSVKVTDDVSNYIQKFQNGLCNKHLSSGIHSTTADEADVGLWRSGTMSEYKVVYSEPTALIAQLQGVLGSKFTYSYSNGLIQFALPTTEDVVRYDNLDAALKAQALKDANRTHHKSKDNLLKLGTQISKGLLSIFGNQIEYSYNNVSTINNNVEKMDLIFRRIFLGGILLGNTVSYICISFDGDGNLISLIIKWPDFVKITDNNSAINMSSALAQASELVSQAINNQTLKAGQIQGIALAWNSIVQDDIIIISPFFSVQTKVTDGDNIDENCFINVPMLNKYYNQ